MVDILNIFLSLINIIIWIVVHLYHIGFGYYALQKESEKLTMGKIKKIIRQILALFPSFAFFRTSKWLKCLFV